MPAATKPKPLFTKKSVVDLAQRYVPVLATTMPHGRNDSLVIERAFDLAEAFLSHANDYEPPVRYEVPESESETEGNTETNSPKGTTDENTEDGNTEAAA